MADFLETLYKGIGEREALQAKPDENPEQPILSMVAIGNLGQFGNQIFQYAFLRIAAMQSGAKVQCSPWQGQALFGHKDELVSKRLPPGLEKWEPGDNIFELAPELKLYLEKLAGGKSCRIGPEALQHGAANVDLGGFFQVHTRHLKPHRAYFESLFQPQGELKAVLDAGLERLRAKGKTIIAVHVRRGDFLAAPLAGYSLVVPTAWWCDWLDQVWSQFDDPVLLVCSNDLDGVLPEFARFNPVTVRDLDIQLPEEVKHLGFYTDFYMLSHADVVGISNSTFGFAACMLNKNGQLFVRPDWDFSRRFVTFEPWNSEPLLYAKGRYFKTVMDALAITYATQGAWRTLQTLLIHLPKSLVGTWITQAYMGFKVQGLSGIWKSVLFNLGYAKVWE
jgi:hypothetical protein